MSRFAAIDIGSNAVRLMIARVEPTAKPVAVKKEAFVRIPLRLGADVFRYGKISPQLQTKLVQTMKGFQNLIDVFEPLSCRACATSAMRDAANGAETAALVAQDAGIDLQIIDGMEEAQLVFSSHIQEQLKDDCSYLFIDVGGGSTELLLYCHGEVCCSESFNVGTVRILNAAMDTREWSRMKHWVKQHVTTLGTQGAMAIGSGGNINRLNRMAKKEEKKILARKTLKQLHANLSALSINERMKCYDLKPDRADVIVPAALIYLSVMEWGKISSIHVPKAGLCDGLIRQQYNDMGS